MSLAVWSIALLHGLFVILVAKFMKSRTAVVVAAVFAAAVGLFTGDPVYIVIDLLAVAGATYFCLTSLPKNMTQIEYLLATEKKSNFTGFFKSLTGVLANSFIAVLASIVILKFVYPMLAEEKLQHSVSVTEKSSTKNIAVGEAKSGAPRPQHQQTTAAESTAKLIVEDLQREGIPRRMGEFFSASSISAQGEKVVFLIHLTSPAAIPITPEIAQQMRAETLNNFKNGACLNSSFRKLLNSGVIIQHQYFLYQSNKRITTVEMSKNDC